MRITQRRETDELIKLIEQAHNKLRETIEYNDAATAQDLLVYCQAKAIDLGRLIEQSEKEAVKTIFLVEGYCELVYNNYEKLAQNQSLNSNKIYKALRQSLIKVENSIKNDIAVRIEAAFLPYKASMWDSLESIWKAAEADAACDAYVVPIPYYDRNPDGSFGEEHYEGNLYPDYVKITDYRIYDLEKRKPDLVFIHNPYDNNNLVTSIHPKYYSNELKENSSLLVYVPYYSTTGGMSEGQRSCPAYYNADYIVIQSKLYREYFDAALPDKKFLPFGSPKLDRVINMCSSPPAPPAAWKEKLSGKKVYFYNTSIGGMLSNTEKFLKKMVYVFKCFEAREDACLVWRPHPLLDQTFDSMRKGYKPAYEALRRAYIERGIGIYDDTADITNTIALCDAYIGDAGTSVTSLFGVAGKPIFVLDNNILEAPHEDDWRGSIIKGFGKYADDAWTVTQGDKLYHSRNNDYRYEYCCSLSEYAAGGQYFTTVYSIGGKHYVCPASAGDILEVGSNGIEKRIRLDLQIRTGGAFYGAVVCGKYIFLFPNKYPAVVRYDTESGKLSYFNNVLSFLKATVRGEERYAGVLALGENLYIASPSDNHIMVVDAQTGKAEEKVLASVDKRGYAGMCADGDGIWLLPYDGMTVTYWNPYTEEVREYDDFPKDMKCKHPVYGTECEERPFGSITLYDGYAYLVPAFGNMYIRLDIASGKTEEWEPPFPKAAKTDKGYYNTWSDGYFVRKLDVEGRRQLFFSLRDTRLYEADLETGDCIEVKIEYDVDELRKHEAGFGAWSKEFRYGCFENAFNSLDDFLSGKIIGKQFDRREQIRAYNEISANCDGTCGGKTYKFLKEKLMGQ